MSIDLSIGAVAVPLAVPKLLAPALTASAASVSSSGGTPAVATPPTPSLILPNPTIGLEPGLGVVVQLHNSNGSVTTSPPTEEQLRLYRERNVPIGAPPAPNAGSPQPSSRSDIVV
jgi:hypothetical protein